MVDLFRKTSLRPNLTPVTITAGTRALFTRGGWHVCKKDLAGALQAALGQGRLKVADLPEREQLFRELRTFTVKVSRATGNESFEALRDKDHDDLVLAVALPVWLHEWTGRFRPTLRVIRRGDSGARKGPPLRIIVCPAGQLPELPLDRPAALVCLADPEPVGSAELPGHALAQLVGSLVLSFADLDAGEHAATWDDPVPPYGRPARELMMSAADGKRLWGFFARTFGGKRQAAPDVLVIADGGDRRALSLAYGLCDALRFPRESVIFRPADPDWQAGSEDEAPNARVYSMTRECRSAVRL